MNCTDNDEYFPSSFPIKTHATLSTVSGIIIIVAVALNSNIIYLFLRGQIHKTSFNLLLLNLCISDLIGAVGFIPAIAVPSIALRNISKSAANVICSLSDKAVVFLIGNMSSIYTLAGIAASRYVLINHPLHRLSYYVKCSRIIYIFCICEWVWVSLFTIPLWDFYDFTDCPAFCKRRWPKYANPKAYGILAVVMWFLVPVFVLLSSFLAAVRTLWLKERPQSTNPSIHETRKRALMLLGALIIIFFLSWMPFTVYVIIAAIVQHFYHGVEGPTINSRIHFVVLAIGLLNAVINPILYSRKAPNFRKNKPCPNHERAPRDDGNNSLAIVSSSM